MRTKHIISFVVLMLSTAFAAGAQNLVNFKLNNGMTVYICEDPSQKDVFGEVVVRTGSYNEPSEYTGLAHYLEHLMFKGTDKIGALDWEKEKPLYDQIIAKYDQMAETSDPAAKEAISKEINDLTVEAGKISLTQEYANLIESIGGNGLNAATSHDYTVYFNTFPANQIRKWLMISSERFVNPVFRTFQTELETVYEEYNMYADNSSSRISTFMFQKAFEGSPYERDVIGLGEHLKNPRISQLIKFYETWYVPGNMALIIAGNVNAKSIIRLIQGTFGTIQPKTVPEVKEYPGFNVKGRVAYSTKFARYPNTVVIFNGVPTGSEDEIALNLCTKVLSNSAKTGLLDKLSIEGDVMGAAASPLSLCHQGRVLLNVVPYYDQAQRRYDSNKRVESLLMDAVKKLSKGDFDPSILESAKVGICRDYDLTMESNSGKANRIASYFVMGKSLDEMMSYKDKVNAISVDDVKRVAAKYLNDNFIVINNEVGRLDGKDKIKKPEYKPIDPPVGVSSAYAQKIKSSQSPAPGLEYFDFADVQTKQINSFSKLYYSSNPGNDIYTLTLKYGANSKLFPELEQAAALMNNSGVMAQFTSDKLKQAFGKLGATYSISADSEYLYVTLRGYESTLKDACLLLTRLILMPSLDNKQLNNLKGSLLTERMIRKKEVDVLGDALEEYMTYGDESEYRTELTDLKIINLDIATLTGSITKATKYAAEIYYSGSMPFDQAYSVLSSNLPLIEGENPSSSPLIRKMKDDYSENTVYFLQNSEAQQAQIYFYIPMGDFDKSKEVYRMAFNQYFGGGFNGLVMQEIREKNSMAYAAFGGVTSRKLSGSKQYFTGYVGTQNDKAEGAVELFTKLLTDMPRNEETMANLKNYLRETLLSSKPDPRSKGMYRASLERQGYDHDPAEEWVAQIDNLTFQDIVDYYNANVKGKPIVIGIVGSAKDINVKNLSKYGKVVRLSEKNIFNDKDVLF